MQQEILQEVRNRLIGSAKYVDYMDGTRELNRVHRRHRLISRYRSPLADVPNYSGGSCKKCGCSQTYKKQFPHVKGGRFNMEM